MAGIKSRTVVVNDKKIKVEELGRKSLKKSVVALGDLVTNVSSKLDKLSNIDTDNKEELGEKTINTILNMDISDIIDIAYDNVDEVLKLMCQELKDEDFEDIRNSEIVDIFNAWVEVNFTMQKQNLKFLDSFQKKKVEKQK